MCSNKKIFVLVLGAAVAALCTGACKKSAETERKEAERAEVRAAEETNELHKRAIDEKNDYLAAVRREQLELRGRLQEEIDSVDKELSVLKGDLHKNSGVAVDPKSKGAQTLDELLRRRQQLEDDMNLLERADERGWDELKATIERDIGNRPRGKI